MPKDNKKERIRSKIIIEIQQAKKTGSIFFLSKKNTLYNYLMELAEQKSEYRGLLDESLKKMSAKQIIDGAHIGLGEDRHPLVHIAAKLKNPSTALAALEALEMIGADLGVEHKAEGKIFTALDCPEVTREAWNFLYERGVRPILQPKPSAPPLEEEEEESATLIQNYYKEQTPSYPYMLNPPVQFPQTTWTEQVLPPVKVPWNQHIVYEQYPVPPSHPQVVYHYTGPNGEPVAVMRQTDQHRTLL